MKDDFRCAEQVAVASPLGIPDYSLHGGMAVIVAAIVVELSSIFFRSPIAVETVGCTV